MSLWVLCLELTTSFRNNYRSLGPSPSGDVCRLISSRCGRPRLPIRFWLPGFSSVDGCFCDVVPGVLMNSTAGSTGWDGAYLGRPKIGSEPSFIQRNPAVHALEAFSTRQRQASHFCFFKHEWKALVHGDSKSLEGAFYINNLKTHPPT